MEEKEKFNQSKYNYQFAQENYYRLTVLLPKSEKDKIKAHAAKCGDASVNAFVNRAIAEAMERDTARLDAQQAAELEALAKKRVHPSPPSKGKKAHAHATAQIRR